MSDYEDSLKEKSKVKTEKQDDPLKRHVTRWDAARDQLILHSLVYVLKKGGVKIPWDEVAKIANPGGTGASIEQHLAKEYKRRLLNGEAVPPPPPRGLKRTIVEASQISPKTPNAQKSAPPKKATPKSNNSKASKKSTKDDAEWIPITRSQLKKKYNGGRDSGDDSEYKSDYTPTKKGKKQAKTSKKKPTKEEDDTYVPESPNKKQKIDCQVKNESLSSDIESSSEKDASDVEEDMEEQKESLVVVLPLPSSRISDDEEQDSEGEEDDSEGSNTLEDGDEDAEGTESSNPENSEILPGYLPPTAGYGPVNNADMVASSFENTFDDMYSDNAHMVGTPSSDLHESQIPILPVRPMMRQQFSDPYASSYDTRNYGSGPDSYNNGSLNTVKYHPGHDSSLNYSPGIHGSGIYTAGNLNAPNPFPGRFDVNVANMAQPSHRMPIGTRGGSFDSLGTSFHTMSSANSFDGGFPQQQFPVVNSFSDNFPQQQLTTATSFNAGIAEQGTTNDTITEGNQMLPDDYESNFFDFDTFF